MKNIVHKINQRAPQAFTLGELAEKTQTTVQGDPAIVISGVGALAHAKAGQITFFDNKKLRNHLSTSKASAVIISAAEAHDCPIPALLCTDPKLIYAQVAQLLHPCETLPAARHPTAVIGENTHIHPDVAIGPHCVIGNGVTIEANVVIEAGVVIGDGCHIGKGTVLYPRVTVYQHCRIGEDCVLHSGVVIGSDGFGYVKNKDRWQKVPQVGGVVVGARVEIGANTTIDRGAIDNTEIGNDVILDNLIQIGHNVKIGDGTAIAACSAIAGSSTIGKHCLIGGAARISGHLTITDNVFVIGCSNVGHSIKKPGAYAGALTTTDMDVWKRNLVRFHQLDNLAQRLIKIEKKLKTEESDV